MIAKIWIWLILLIVLPDALVTWRYMRRHKWWKLLLWWLPSIWMVVYTMVLAREPHFLPLQHDVLNVYLFLLGLIVVPKAILILCSLVGRFGRYVGYVLVAICWLLLFWGTFVGFYQFEVKHVELAFDDLPSSFDGYRIVHFSDAHLGTLTGGKSSLLQRAVDSINAQHPDLIVFTGDMQNQLPQEVLPHLTVLKQLKAKDGICSVLGNHDYPEYVEADNMEKINFEQMAVGFQENLDWRVLRNSRYCIRRGDERIFIAGMENDGEGRFPQLGDINRTLAFVRRSDFVVMLEHDPTSWRRKILPHCHAQLTLSGHTHAAQFEIFGWSPVSFHYREYDGLYELGGRYLYVSKGLGGVIPFRVGAPGEIVVFTLRSKHKK